MDDELDGRHTAKPDVKMAMKMKMREVRARMGCSADDDDGPLGRGARLHGGCLDVSPAASEPGPHSLAGGARRPPGATLDGPVGVWQAGDRQALSMHWSANGPATGVSRWTGRPALPVPAWARPKQLDGGLASRCSGSTRSSEACSETRAGGGRRGRRLCCQRGDFSFLLRSMYRDASGMCRARWACCAGHDGRPPATGR
jgi:hypothetical protein